RAQVYEKRIDRLRRRSVDARLARDGPCANVRPHAGADAGSTRDLGSRVLAERLAARFHRRRSAERHDTRAQPLAARRSDWRTATADDGWPRRARRALVTRRTLDRVPVGPGRITRTSLSLVDVGR